MLKFINSFYITVLGILIGAVLVLGTMVAPTIFHTEPLIGSVLSHYQAGVVMSSIFSKFGYFLNGMILIVIVYEINLAYQKRKIKPYDLLVTIILIGSMSFFTFYLMPSILELQALKETTTEQFNSLHKLSEFDFKVILASAFMMIFLRLSKFEENNILICKLKK